MEKLINELKARNEALKSDRTLSGLGRAGRIAENKRTIRLLEAGGYKDTSETIEPKTDSYSNFLRDN